MANHLDRETSLPEDAALRAIVEGVESETGDRFFSSLVQHLATALDCQYSFVTELRRDTQSFRTLAVWGRGKFLDNFEIPLRGTPCESVLNGQIAHYPEHIQQLFPDDEGIKVWGAESYCGVPLPDAAGVCVGHLAIFDDKPMYEGPRGLAIMRIFAARARAEIERLRVENALRASEERYRDLYENAPVPIMSADRDARIRTWNRCFAEWLGYTSEELAGKSTADLIPDKADARAQYNDLVEKFLAGVPTYSELEAVRADGTRVWATASVRPIRDAGGKVTSTQSVFVDLSGRKRAEDALRESEERFRDLFDEAPIAYVHEGLDSRFIEANRTAMRILGLKPDEVAGMIGASLVPDTPAAQRRLSEWLDAMARGTASTGTVLELRRKDDGKPVWIQCWSRPAPDGSYTRTMFVDVTDRVLVEREKARLQAQNTYLIEEIKETHNFEEIVGRSATLAAMLEKVRLVAATDSSVLILGETGTGKELISRAVHSNSARKDRPLIKVNCAALPVGLVESELFGHEKGSFTGATEKRIGRFELANGGTILLDEIGEVPPELQVKLLRVLQEHEFERIGGSQTIKVDVRVIASTNRDLAREVAEGKFRQDLYYRLNVFPLRIPPLRERPEDIGLLVHYFVRRYATKIGRKITRVAKETMERLVAYPWPGNVRELENVVERGVILSPGADLEIGPEIRAATSPVAVQPDPWPVQAEERTSMATDAAHDSHESLSKIERGHIVAVLKRTKWRIDGPNGAARALSLNPSTLRSRMKKLGIRRDASDI